MLTATFSGCSSWAVRALLSCKHSIFAFLSVSLLSLEARCCKRAMSEADSPLTVILVEATIAGRYVSVRYMKITMDIRMSWVPCSTCGDVGYVYPFSFQ